MDVKLEKYEGPLDLLLRLIQRSEIDIYDIPISQITAEYLEVVATLPPDMEQMSEFLVMAATLLEIKSKMLLPCPKTDDDEPEEDPREALTRQLLAHQQAQELAALLDSITPTQPILGAGDKDTLLLLSDKTHSAPVMDLISIPELEKIFAQVMQLRTSKIDTVRSGYGEMPKERFSVTEKISLIKNFLLNRKSLSLHELFFRCATRHEMIVTFLALLEMVRRGMVLIYQKKSFDDVDLVAV
ncbi:MAG: segregation/condensation protein A [Clostridiales bacterium]|jgi:segregation and condensation protein A|nr:segregation/condensation protein A [Clostridiales bacterium]